MNKLKIVSVSDLRFLWVLILLFSGMWPFFSLDEWKAMLPEGLPASMMKEFQETRRCAVMVRESFLDLRDNFRRIVDPAIAAKRKGVLILLHDFVSVVKIVPDEFDLHRSFLCHFTHSMHNACMIYLAYLFGCF